QLASLAPPVHVAVFRRTQVMETLEEVLAAAPAPRESGRSAPRSIVFITGSSRTADIEQITIHGVHGPTQIHAILAEDSCLE
ncbi:MAG: LUD domain-containing protein, partial [Terriglobia bacterium]